MNNSSTPSQNTSHQKQHAASIQQSLFETPEHISGPVERVTFHSVENGFCVLRVKVKGHKDLVTVTGNAASISPGEHVDCEGVWFNNVKYGLEFKAKKLTIIAPSTIEGIEKYLGSGMIRGVGPYFANVLIKAFGDTVFEVIEKNPEKLRALPGIGDKRLSWILDSWAEQKVIREIMVFLQSYGVSTSRAVRIFKTYGNDAISIVSQNPYQLALDIHGIGFHTADTIALKLGIAKDSLIRSQAGVRHALQEMSSQGHCGSEYHELIANTASLLEISEELALSGLQSEIANGNCVEETIDEKNIVFLPALVQSEKGVASRLHKLSTGKCKWSHVDVNKAMHWLEGKTNIIFSDSQKQALTFAFKHKVMVITGGPGVGKTTLVKSIVQLLLVKQFEILLCAPTGRAAKRLSEATGQEAKTIHRLLAFDPKINGFKHTRDNPLSADMVIVDEASMIDVVLMNQLLKAIPDHAGLMLVGDIDQLPSVGPGTILADIINSQTIPTIRLTEIFRQAANSQIIINAHRINKGTMPIKDNDLETVSDFHVIQCTTPEEISEKLLYLVSERIPKRFGFDPIRDIQVLTPMNRGGLGSRNLNVALKKLLNTTTENQITKFGTSFSPGDKVLQTVNNYTKEVFNGDIGTIRSIDLDQGCMIIDFDSRLVSYELHEIDEIALAFAASIHKSQGSEYPVVVIPLAMQHYMMLERNLLYTGVTRGKKLVVIIAQAKALAIAVKNKRTSTRLTTLIYRLKQLLTTASNE